MTGMTDIRETAMWFALSPLGPWFWARLALLLAACALLGWWALRAPAAPGTQAFALRLRATRQSLAKAVAAADQADPRTPAKLAAAVRTLLDAVHGGRSFRAATADEVAKRTSDPGPADFLRAAERALYAPGGADPAAVRTLKDRALRVIESYRA